MSKPYNPIVIDEVMYWFDILQDNSFNNIHKVSGIEINKIQDVLDNRFNKLIPIYGKSVGNMKQILEAS